jgi:protocatechuate 3,4-dioxygenase beta subunit
VPTEEQQNEPKVTRRAALGVVGGAAAALVAGRIVADASEGEAASGGPAAVSSGAVTCVLTPELTEGPFYLPGEPFRRKITEGRPGIPLLLRATVVDASACRPITNASVDVWHCDALGIYSGVAGNGGRFMRGLQKTDAKGLATFQTVYPGWYSGRAVHIHVKVHIAGRVVHTGQLFFPDRISDSVYRHAPYSRRGARDTRNAEDSIFRNGGRKSIVRLREKRHGYVAAITMGVHRS